MSLSKVYTALERMRELTSSNIPFSLSFYTYSIKTNQSKGLRNVDKAILRTGYSTTKSQYSSLLIAYYDLELEREGFFWLPALMKFNQNELK